MRRSFVSTTFQVAHIMEDLIKYAELNSKVVDFHINPYESAFFYVLQTYNISSLIIIIQTGLMRMRCYRLNSFYIPTRWCVREKSCISTTHDSTAETLTKYNHPVIIKTKIAKSPKLNYILGFTQPHSQIQFCLFLGGGPLNFYYVLNKTFVDTSWIV
jgi:hypothetical protein